MGYVAAGIAVAGVASAAAVVATAPGDPQSPDYARANREAIQADIDTLPVRRMIEAASKSGKRVEYADPSTGEKKVADFTGLGDSDISRANFDAGLENASKLAGKSLELSQQYGEKFVEQRRKELQASDPAGWSIRETMGKSILADLQAGKSLDPGLRADVVEAERSGQAARGNILGDSSAAAEAMQVGNAGFRLWQQKLANAASFLSGTTPTAQFQQLTGAQQGASPFTPIAPQAGIGLNAGAGQAGANYSLGLYGQQSQNWATAQANNPWQSLLGGVSGLGLGTAGAAIGNRMQQG